MHSLVFVATRWSGKWHLFEGLGEDRELEATLASDSEGIRPAYLQDGQRIPYESVQFTMGSHGFSSEDGQEVSVVGNADAGLSVHLTAHRDHMASLMQSLRSPTFVELRVSLSNRDATEMKEDDGSRWVIFPPPEDDEWERWKFLIGVTVLEGDVATWADELRSTKAVFAWLKTLEAREGGSG